MITGFVDTTVTVHIYRGDKDAVAWIKGQGNLAITPVGWMELIYGVNGLRGQLECLKLLRLFTLVHLTLADQIWAMEKLLEQRLSHGVAVNDCLIASVCQRLELPLYTHNIKHMTRILEPALVIKPY